MQKDLVEILNKYMSELNDSDADTFIYLGLAIQLHAFIEFSYEEGLSERVTMKTIMTLIKKFMMEIYGLKINLHVEEVPVTMQ